MPIAMGSPNQEPRVLAFLTGSMLSSHSYRIDVYFGKLTMGTSNQEFSFKIIYHKTVGG